MKRPLPSHHGHVTVLGVPPRWEMTWPVPWHGRQRSSAGGGAGGCGLTARHASAARRAYARPGGATERAARLRSVGVTVGSAERSVGSERRSVGAISRSVSGLAIPNLRNAS